MDTAILEDIGLNKSEISVYLALLKLGPSSTGPIVKESKTANSKIYEVLDKLIAKGLVSHFLKSNVRQYKASSPKMILEYVKEKKKTLEEQEKDIAKTLPSLLSFEAANKEETEASVYTGKNGIKTAFIELVENLKKGDELHIMGVHDFGQEFMDLALFFQKIRSKKGIKAKFLMNNNAKKVAKEFKKYQPINIKFMQEEIFTPGIFIIHKEGVIINLPEDLTFFVLKSKNASKSFDAYFKVMWEQGRK